MVDFEVRMGDWFVSLSVFIRLFTGLRAQNLVGFLIGLIRNSASHFLIVKLFEARFAFRI